MKLIIFPFESNFGKASLRSSLTNEDCKKIAVHIIRSLGLLESANGTEYTGRPVTATKYKTWLGIVKKQKKQTENSLLAAGLEGCETS